MPNECTISQRIAELRTASGESQQQVADAIGVRQQTFGDWERGRTEPGAQHVLALAHHFACSADYLLGASATRSILPPNCWVVDDDVVATLRSADKLPEAWNEEGEYWAFPIPSRSRIISSVEMAALRAEVERLVRSKRRGRR